jgi:hypothetical protein
LARASAEEADEVALDALDALARTFFITAISRPSADEAIIEFGSTLTAPGRLAPGATPEAAAGAAAAAAFLACTSRSNWDSWLGAGPPTLPPADDDDPDLDDALFAWWAAADPPPLVKTAPGLVAGEAFRCLVVVVVEEAATCGGCSLAAAAAGGGEAGCCGCCCGAGGGGGGAFFIAVAAVVPVPPEPVAAPSDGATWLVRTVVVWGRLSFSMDGGMMMILLTILLFWVVTRGWKRWSTMMNWPPKLLHGSVVVASEKKQEQWVLLQGWDGAKTGKGKQANEASFSRL